MNSTWNSIKITYYIGKIFGLFPFTGKCTLLSLLYSLIICASLCVLNLYMVFSDYINITNNNQPRRKLLISVISFRLYLKYVITIFGIMMFVQKNEDFFKLIDKFHQFDTLTLQLHCPSNLKTQNLYLSSALLITIYHLTVLILFSKFNPILLMSRTLLPMSTMLIIVQFVIFVRQLRERYKLANNIFLSNMNKSLNCPRVMYPNEIVKVFNELRSLTEEVKNFYAFHIVIIIVDSILLFVSCVTVLTLNLTNKIIFASVYNELFLIFCSMKLLFILLMVQETHNTTQEANKTVLIAHETLSITTNIWIIKELEIFIMTYWSRPITFDVYDVFDLDYGLLQRIIGSIVTYAVVLVQIQLAMFQTT